MMPRPAIFISAVSGELKSARQLVANTLHFLGYEGVWQEVFGTEEGDLREMLRRKIDGCEGVIQLVGKCYGFEPPAPDEQFGRVSYTQYEALYAQQRGKKVWYLFLEEGFPAAGGAEPEEKRQLQQAYQARVRAEGQLRHKIGSDMALEAVVLKLRDDLSQLRRRGKQWAALVLALLVLLGAGMAWMKIGQQKQEHQIAQVSEQNEKLLQALRELPQAVSQSAQAGQKEDEATRLARAYATLEDKLQIPKGTLEKELPEFARQLLARADTSALDRANALFATRQFADAEKAALEAKDKALAAAGQPVHDAVRALRLAGQSAQAQIQYARALDHYRAAEALTNQERDPVEWAGIEWDMAHVLEDNGQYHDAESLCRSILAVFQRVHGPEDPDTLKIRNNLAIALYDQGKYAAAEEEDRAVLALRTRVLGEEHPDTLASRNNLALALDEEGKYAEAEKEYRALLVIEERVLGPEDPDTLGSRSNLASALDDEGKYADAEKEDRLILAIRGRVPGPDHPKTLASRNNLAVVLEHEGKYADAEKEYRALLPIEERVLGPEHPDTLASRTNLALTLDALGKYADAEKENRAALASMERVLGPDHPHTVIARDALADVLEEEGRFADAEQERRAVLAIRQRVLGPEHPDTLVSENDVAWLLVEEGKYHEAEEEIRPAIEIMVRVLGPESRTVVNSGDTLGEALRGQGKLKEAEAEDRSVLSLGERTLGKDDSLVLSSCYHLALTLEAEKSYGEALALARRAEAGFRKRSGEESKVTKDAAALRVRLETEGGGS